LQATSTSGGIVGAWVDRVSNAYSTSGAINLSGDFATSAQIGTTGGSVTLRFTPAASVHIEASSVSGDVNAVDLDLTSRLRAPRALSGNIAHGDQTVTIRTISGSISLLHGG
jgi:DUF4097 and DUF4098 domain-containing protein YvlB